MDFLINTVAPPVMYFLPSIIAWLRVRSGKPIESTLSHIFIFNLLLAWTIVGWFLMLFNALGYNPIAWLVPKLAKPGSGGGGGAGGRPVPYPQGNNSPGGQPCGQCGGSGTMICSHCQGRGSWYIQPTSAHESAQLQSCSNCMTSGRIRCPYCGGSRF